jgi:thioredoxin reductase (NADPH)
LGTVDDVQVGEELIRSGDRSYDLIAVDSGEVEILREHLGWEGETLLARAGSGSFVGELGLLNGQSAMLTARVSKAGRMVRVSRAELRQLIAEDDSLGDLILQALWARRESLRHGPAAQTVKLVGLAASGDLLALRRYAERLNLAHSAVEIEPDAVSSVIDAQFDVRDLPVAIVHNRPITQATPGQVAERLGLSYQAQVNDEVDLVVIGGGPAGLAAAIYGASEGLKTVLLDALAPGGQAASTSRIENFLGFPFGVSGSDLTGKACLQALKFGVHVFAPCEAVSLQEANDRLALTLADGSDITTRAAIVTTGARYRTLQLPGWTDFERSGIYYAATPLEARQVAGGPVIVLGGANSAGQASLFLASQGCSVRLVVRGDGLETGMSKYLIDRITEDGRITLHLRTHVVGLEGDTRLQKVRLDTVGEVEARGLFCLIGATPATAWLAALDLDEHGFILTGSDIHLDGHERWERAGREPLPFETSTPRIFAAGDVRRGSMKRVAAAVGEGSSAVASVHRALVLG